MKPWMHCNICLSTTPSNLFMTSCGKVLCGQCMPRFKSRGCPDCRTTTRGLCSEVKLDKNAPSDVLILFRDISFDLKKVFKVNNFQESQKRRLLDGLLKKENYLATKLSELKAKQRQAEERYHQAKRRNEELDQTLVELERRVSALCSEGNDKNNSTERTLTRQSPGKKMYNSRNSVENSFSRMFFSPPPNSKMMPRASKDKITKSGGNGKNTDANAGFLQMKTPAAWNRGKNGGFMTANPSQTQQHHRVQDPYFTHHPILGSKMAPAVYMRKR